MLQRIKNILGIIIVSLVVTTVALNLPSQWLNLSKFFSMPKFGTAFSQLSGSNTVASFPTTYNSNLTLTANLTTSNTFTGTLNSFLQSSSTQLSAYLAYFGATATSSFSGTGALTLATPLAITSGGTGSTTLSVGQLLIGAGTGNVNVVSGYGTSGQFLTSNGSGLAPTWTTSIIDQTLNYNFTGSVFNIKNLNASSTVANPLVLNTVSYNTPSTQGAVGTSLVNDGSGNLLWSGPARYTYGTNSDFGIANGYATSTAINIPAGFITASSTISVTGTENCNHTSGAANCTYYLRTSTGVTIASFAHSTGSSGNNNATLTFTFKTILNNSVSSQLSTFSAIGVDSSGVLVTGNSSTDQSSSINMANAFSLVLVAQGADANTTPTVYNFNIVIEK